MPARLRALWLLACALTLGAGCSTSQGSAATTRGSELSIVTTTTVLGDIISNVVADAAVVEVLIPPGADPHGFEASPRQAELLRQADLVVVNGLGLEETLASVLAAAEADGAPIVTVADKVDPLPFARAERDHGALDPHFWMDPVRVRAAVDVLTDELTRIDDATNWTALAEPYAAELHDLHTEIAGLVDQIPAHQRKLVTNHEALGYFVARYGFEQVGAVIPGGSTLAEPGSAALVELAAVIRRERVPAIFTESTRPDQLAQALAAEVGNDIAVVELFTDSLGAGAEADTYVDLLRTDAQRISDALTRGSG